MREQNKGLEESLEALFSKSEWQGHLFYMRKSEILIFITVICSKSFSVSDFFSEKSRCRQIGKLDENTYRDIFIKISLYVTYIVHA